MREGEEVWQDQGSGGVSSAGGRHSHASTNRRTRGVTPAHARAHARRNASHRFASFVQKQKEEQLQQKVAPHLQSAPILQTHAAGECSISSSYRHLRFPRAHARKSPHARACARQNASHSLASVLQVQELQELVQQQQQLLQLQLPIAQHHGGEGGGTTEVTQVGVPQPIVDQPGQQQQWLWARQNEQQQQQQLLQEQPHPQQWQQPQWQQPQHHLQQYQPQPPQLHPPQLYQHELQQHQLQQPWQAVSEGSSTMQFYDGLGHQPLPPPHLGASASIADGCESRDYAPWQEESGTSPENFVNLIRAHEERLNAVESKIATLQVGPPAPHAHAHARAHARTHARTPGL
jgi:hypothetical protein